MPRKDFYLRKRRFKKVDVWYVRFRHPKTGEILNDRSTGLGNKTAAEKWAAREYSKFVHEIARPPVLFREWAERFYLPDCPHVTRLRAEGRSFAEYTRKDCRRILERDLLGSEKYGTDPDPIVAMRLGDITRGDVLAFRERKVAKYGMRRIVQRCVSILGVVIREAVFREVIDRDPVAGVGGLKVETRRRVAITMEQVRALLNPALFEDRMHFEATFLAALTGMRAGEVRGLQWQDLDFDAAVIHVRRAFKSYSTELGPPKWGKLRTVPLPVPLEAMLRPAAGVPTAWVFGRFSNDPLGYDKWLAAIRKAVKAAGLPAGVATHSLRHSLQTALREDGISDELLRASFGWSSPAVQDNYTHRDLYQTGPQAAAVGRLLGGSNVK